MTAVSQTGSHRQPYAAAIRASEDEAYLDAVKAIARDIPDPGVFARWLTLRQAQILCGATARKNGEYRVSPADAPELRSLGLVEFGGCCLGAFGMAVRRELLRENG